MLLKDIYHAFHIIYVSKTQPQEVLQSLLIHRKFLCEKIIDSSCQSDIAHIAVGNSKTD